MRRDLPAGTVTFLFTDVEGSTKLLHELGGEAYAATLAEHRRVVRKACTARAGVEVDTQGDAFFVAFPTPERALEAARAITEELASGPIALRIGLHTGTPLLTEEGYVGEDVHFAARVAASAHGGQVVLSQTTRALLDEHHPLVELGEHRLKDIPEPVAIFQLGDREFPPLKTISNTNLPRPASSFVGRERELREVLARIDDGARLLTLTGPGGTGKTRLALEAAATLVPEYKAGVFCVGLAALHDPTLVTETIAQTIGAKDGLGEHIGEREMLLLLDNFEQVIEAAPELSNLLRECPNLTPLITSRELLRVQGEVEYPVPPLAEAEAVSLFCERAQTEPSEEIAELCRRLDNLPLAVELAAARTKALSPAQILERLSGRLDLLKGGRDADPRQQTLRATIEWSYSLLSDDEKQLFRGLAVFAGGCTLEAAEQVCRADLDALQSLVEKSLVRFSYERYWMLETIRDFVSELLEHSEDAVATRERHADYYLRFAAGVAVGLRGGDVRSAVNALDQETENLRLVLAWLEQAREIDAELTLIADIWRLWRIRGRWLEGRQWIESALTRSIGTQSKSRAHVLHAALVIAGTIGELEVAKRHAEECLSAFRTLDDGEGMAFALEGLGLIAMELDDFAEASRVLEEATIQAANAGARVVEAHATANLAELAQRRRDYERATRLTRDALLIYRELGDDEGLSWTLCNLAYCLFRTNSLSAAVSTARKSLRVARVIHDTQVIAWDVLLLAAIAVQTGHVEKALRLTAAVEAVCTSTSLRFSGIEVALHQETASEVLGAVGQDSYEAALGMAHRMPLSDIVDYALDVRI
jgi:predicted ATPase/class 3 adenylate cyclase